MPLMNIPFPKLLLVTLKYLDFANGEITLFEKPIFNRFINVEEIIDKPLSKSFSDYNYYSTIFMFTYANKLQLWALCVLMYPILLILSKLLKYKAFRFLRVLEKGFRFNMILRIMIELYLEMTLLAFMNIYSF